MNFSRRLLLGSVVVLLVTVAVLVVAAERWLRVDLEENVATTLTDQARLVMASLPADSLEWPEYSRRAGRAGRVRITLIDGAGRVRADTDVPDAELPQVENHNTRPEVSAALRGERGTDTRRSTTTSTEFMYVAVRGGPGVVRVAMPLDQVHRLNAAIRDALSEPEVTQVLQAGDNLPGTGGAQDFAQLIARETQAMRSLLDKRSPQRH